MIQRSTAIEDFDQRPAFMRVSRLHSIKTRLLVFALIATIIPSVTLGSLAYVQITRFLHQKISQNLQNITAQVSRELDLSIKERTYDIRIFSSSYIITENLAVLTSSRKNAAEREAALRMMNAYLQSIRKRFDSYCELMIANLDGTIIASSNGNDGGHTMPANWERQIGEKRYGVSEAYLDTKLNDRVMVLTEPIRNAENIIVGVMCAKLSLSTIEKTLAEHVSEDTDTIYLVNGSGRHIAGSSKPVGDHSATMDHRTILRLLENPKESISYKAHQDRMVIGTMATIPSMNLRVIAETDRNVAYRRISNLQRLTLLLTGGIILLIGFSAYVLALTIVHPLKRLGRGAAKVAAGDLSVDLPVRNHSEVGYLTQVFNHMVQKLRHGVEELDRVNAILREKNQDLHQISITDPLTGLYNRKQLMEVLNSELARSMRHDYRFSLLMIDIDHFKSINDTYGHQKGDDVLCALAAIFGASIRKCDYAARYGGEEFVLLLTETNSEGAVEVAHRIRKSASSDQIATEKGSIAYTVSIGIGSFPENGNDAKAIIEHADMALYAAKEGGRNQVKVAQMQS